VSRLPVEELALEGLGPVAPERADGADRLLGSRGALPERNADYLELLLQPSDPHAQNRAAPGEYVERGEILGHVRRVPLREDHDARGQAELLGDGGGVGEGEDRIRDGRVRLPRHPSVFGVGIAGAVLGWDHHVLRGPDGFDADRVGGPDHHFEDLGSGKGADVCVEEAELHAGPPGARGA
jgi:hypothetical protein